MTINEIKIRDYKQANAKRWLDEEADKIQQLRQKAKIIKKVNCSETAATNLGCLGLCKLQRTTCNCLIRKCTGAVHQGF